MPHHDIDRAYSALDLVTAVLPGLRPSLLLSAPLVLSEPKLAEHLVYAVISPEAPKVAIHNSEGRTFGAFG